uniref:Serine/threonine-protein phosphatase with EF-hands n=1 Tax=Callorhinchus milii TaxID=7868 RepID=A0A4W3I7V0_CALMI
MGQAMVSNNHQFYSLHTIKSAILIQRWYRRFLARMEMKRRYAWSIFQSIEYSGEQDQLQVNFIQIKYLITSLIFNELIILLIEEVPEYERIEIPDSYTGPRLSFPLTPVDGNILLKAFKHQQQLHPRYVLQLLHETKKFLKQIPNITHLSTHFSKEVTVCGDLHGKLDDLLLIFYKNGLPTPEKPYVFNGDFVDRGKNSMEIIIILFAFLLIYPNDLHLNRGNHEDHIMNLRYGFKKEVVQKYKFHSRRILQLIQEVFSWLPLATIIDHKVLVLHGGISDATDLDILASIERCKLKSALRPPKACLERKDEKCLGRSGLEEQYSQLLDSNGNVQEPLKVRRTSRNNAFCLERQTSGSSVSSSSPLSSHYLNELLPSHLNHKQKQLLDGNERERLQHNEYCSTTILEVSHLDCEVPIPKKATRVDGDWKQVSIVDILWSDPKSLNGCFPNSFRGGGCYFGPDITERMLKKYNLKLLIRSHECKQDGYELCHNGKVITIFSASNYYEECSNRGAYIKLGPDLVPRFVQYQVSKYTRKMTLRQRVGVVEASALKSLQEKLYAHRSEVIAAFKQFDENNTGKITTSEWATAVESVLHLDLPWRTLRPRMVRLADDGNVQYLSSFEDLQIEQPMKDAQPSLIESMYRHRADLEIIFGMIDKDHSGMISIEEFRQTWKLFSSHLHINTNDQSIDDFARSIDFNKDGNIDFNEFLEAFRLVYKCDQKDNN